MSGKKMTEGQITILKQILIIAMHIASLVKRPCYLLKLSSRNENMDVSRADNSVKNWQNWPLAIPNLISLLSIHTASLVKIPCYLLKLSSGNENMGVSRADNSVKICPLATPNQISLMSMHIASWKKIRCYLLKLSSGNENMGVSRADNSVKIWRNLPISNPKPDLLNVNAYSKFDENPFLFTQVIVRKGKYGRVSGRQLRQKLTKFAH